ncbi:MAG: glycoside hydrolase family 88 protein [Melioribacteraceae bacterium]|nr:glycoside hydrolase family 88 protein [Melioribacteraceae bacterium]MCF8265487.1 glycoside hydrolase family 88 protein [Melioribacteraceae bacterium]MCF8432731.1 glycoside hydrolase family 88 protein [Melioribacteraceae bacterium]
MRRRKFIQGAVLMGGATISPSLLGGCAVDGSINPSDDVQILRKVKNALLSMQRASWEQGVSAQAFLECGDIETVVLMAYESVLRQTEDGRLSVLYTDNGVTDPAASGEALLHAAKITGDNVLIFAAEKMLNYLVESAPRSNNGILYHTINSPEIWIDSMYMAPPFLAAANNFAEAIKQIVGMREILWNSNARLYSHRWHDDKKEFINEKFWGVGNGWALVGICRVINLLPVEYEKEREILIIYLIENLEGCLKFLRKDGLFHNIIDDKNSFIETNLSQMVAYTIYCGIKSGWLESQFMPKAELMRSAVRNKIDENGFVQGVCGAPYFNSPGRAAEGQAFYIMMESARNKLKELSRNKEN